MKVNGRALVIAILFFVLLNTPYIFNLFNLTGSGVLGLLFIPWWLFGYLPSVFATTEICKTPVNVGSLIKYYCFGGRISDDVFMICLSTMIFVILSILLYYLITRPPKKR